jgi:hypothetical protein
MNPFLVQANFFVPKKMPAFSWLKPSIGISPLGGQGDSLCEDAELLDLAYLAAQHFANDAPNTQIGREPDARRV